MKNKKQNYSRGFGAKKPKFRVGQSVRVIGEQRTEGLDRCYSYPFTAKVKSIRFSHETKAFVYELESIVFCLDSRDSLEPEIREARDFFAELMKPPRPVAIEEKLLHPYI